MTTPCPICGDIGGFHLEEVHDSLPRIGGTSLPPPDPVKLCRACGEPLSDPGLYGCRYPNHAKEVS